jgi:putative heme-binding domain-containing protein
MSDWFAAATDTAVRTQMKETAPLFARFCTPSDTGTADLLPADTLATFARAWLTLAPGQAIPTLARVLAANHGVVAYRETVADLLASQNTPVAQTAVVAGLKALPLKSQEKLSYTMASATFSAETLLTAIENGAVSPRVLQRVGVHNRLKSSRPRDWEARVARLTKTLSPANEQLEKLVEQRRAAYQPANARLNDGAALFTKNCAACHSIGGQGGNVGPQLDGIGQRGLERLCEDILDPNRNVDGAFRTTLLELKDGEVTSGLLRREEGELVVLAESTGKEISVPKKDIAGRRQSETSLMPENFGELLSAEEFNHLMVYLLSKKAQP